MRLLSLYVFHPLTLIPILAQWNSNSKESQTLGLLAVDENLLFLEYVCNCKAKVGFVSICKMTKTEWVDSWQQPRCYSQWHWKWHLPTTLWCLGPRSPIKAHNQLVTCACCWVAWTTDFLKLWAKSFVTMGFLPDPGPIHCLTGPKAYIDSKTFHLDTETFRKFAKVLRPGNVVTKLV